MRRKLLARSGNGRRAVDAPSVRSSVTQTCIGVPELGIAPNYPPPPVDTNKTSTSQPRLAFGLLVRLDVANKRLPVATRPGTRTGRLSSGRLGQQPEATAWPTSGRGRPDVGCNDRQGKAAAAGGGRDSNRAVRCCACAAAGIRLRCRPGRPAARPRAVAADHGVEGDDAEALFRFASAGARPFRCAGACWWPGRSVLRRRLAVCSSSGASTAMKQPASPFRWLCFVHHRLPAPR